MNDRDVLPDSVKPINYAISLFNLDLQDSFRYRGTVKISAKVLKRTRILTLNAHQLEIEGAEANIGYSDNIQSTEISYNVQKQRVSIEFANELPTSDSTITILIRFSGTMNDSMAGFYRSKYKSTTNPENDNDYKYMFSTQFESSDARRAFPCFDEPNLKATFDFEIEVPQHLVVLSNMPESSVRTGLHGLKTVAFERTPVMSTYLVAWAVGDFEYVEAFTERKYNGKSIPVRVYTTKGLSEQGHFALEHGHKIIDYFSEIFDIEYPLPKLDMLAVHEFSHGAMENWGLVTYRTTAILFDEKISDSKYQNSVAYVVAHELAHQWFGNLVTMEWWNELWLNEGFATWVGWLAVDFFHPDWNVWPQFVAEGLQLAFSLDSLESSHPVEVPVRDALEVDQIFDHISYLKGSSVICMLATHLGHETFLQGVADYLKTYAYGNTTKKDLWSKLSKVSSLEVDSLMDPWIAHPGYPVITVTEDPGQLNITQRRYKSTIDDGGITDVDNSTWWIPLRFKKSVDAKEISPVTLSSREASLKLEDSTFYKINTDTTGFYRTCYPSARLAIFGQQIGFLSISDKIGLIGDASALAISGEATTPSLLAFVESFTLEDNYLVWLQIISSLEVIQSIFSGDTAIFEGLQAFILRLTSSVVMKLGWSFRPGEDYLMGQLRALIIKVAGLNGDKGIIHEAQRQFEALRQGDSSAVHPSLRSAVLQVVIQHGGESEYDSVRNEWLNTKSPDGKETALIALGQFRDLSLLSRHLDFLFSDVAVQDLHTGARILSENHKTRLGLWEYIQAHFDILKERLGTNMVVFDRVLKVSLQNFADIETEKTIVEFFNGKDNRGYDRTLAAASDTIRRRAAYKARDKDVLLDWLRIHGYTKPIKIFETHKVLPEARLS